MWGFQASGFSVFIQTQENVNRMRIVVQIGDASTLSQPQLLTLLEANYHTALDARYAVTDDVIVATFIHPLRELTLTQFILGIYQSVHCAETYGTDFSGGTLVFGTSQGGSGIGQGEDVIELVMDQVVRKIRGD